MVIPYIGPIIEMGRYFAKAISGVSKTAGEVKDFLDKTHGKTNPVTGGSDKGGSRYNPKNYEAYNNAYRPATAALLIPLILGAAWMAYLVVGSKAKPAEAQLSPATNSLVVSLFIFIIVYSVFLVMLFWGRRNALEKKEAKQAGKHIRPSKKKK